MKSLRAARRASGFWFRAYQPYYHAAGGVYGGAHGVPGMQAPLAGSPPMAPYMGYPGFHPGPRQAAYGGMVRSSP